MAADKHKGVQYNIRLDAGLLRALRKAAKKNCISASAEIAMRLGKSFTEEKLWGVARDMNLAWISNFAWTGEQAAQIRKIEKNRWINDRECLNEAWLAASQAVLDRITPSLSDRALLLERLHNGIRSQQLTAEMHRAAAKEVNTKGGAA